MTRLTHSDMAHEMSRALRACDQWLEDHSAKRPEHEVTVKRRRREALAQAQHDYERAAARERENAA